MADAERKLQELILYVADRSVDDPDFGATKLNKILAACDFESYALLGRAVTGVPYQKLEHGPVPRRLLPLQRELIDAGSAMLLPRQVASYTQRRLVALRDPDLTVFSGPEMALIDRVIDGCRGKNAVTLSRISHEADGWKAAAVGDDIPYSTAYWSEHDLTSDDIDRARELAAAER
jgi:Protein of unknown function (DUF4065)